MRWTLHTEFPAHLKDAWNALLDEAITNVPFLRYEYLEAWWETRGGGEWPQAQLAIITAHEGDRLVGIAPLFYTPTIMGDRLCSFWAVLRSPITWISSSVLRI